LCSCQHETLEDAKEGNRMTVYVVGCETGTDSNTIAVYADELEAQQFIQQKRGEPGKRPYPYWYLESFAVRQVHRKALRGRGGAERGRAAKSWGLGHRYSE
jgi:hypothetical protein